MADEEQARIRIVGGADQRQQRIDGREIDGLVEAGVDGMAIALRQLRQRLGYARRGRGKDDVEADTEAADLAAHRPRRLAAPRVQRPLEIARAWNIPAGLG